MMRIEGESLSPNITDEGIEYLKSLGSLIDLSLIRAPISASGQEDLKAALLKAKISF